MTLAETMRELEAAGTAQNRKVYARHGVDGPMFGVSYANLGKLQKRIKTDNPLALGLWDSGNHDARILATKIADRCQCKVSQWNAWARSLGNVIQSGALADAAADSPNGAGLVQKWIGSRNRTVQVAGWHLLACLSEGNTGLPDGFFRPYIGRIEREIHDHTDQLANSMNGALISIGVRSPGLTRLALAAAGRIGVVEVDHGETGCKTPDATAYIQKTLAHRARKKS
jgi:3-methyladenine DNA glycosylase AlkD